jgi:4-hydroxybenzoate polyprenyltransferase
MKKISTYLSLIKFSHTIFAMPFAMIGFFLGVQFNQINNVMAPPNILKIHPVFYKLIFVILCMIFARSAAMAFNRFLDRKIDALNPRTAIREIPSGLIKPQNALYFTIFCSLLFVLSALAINKLCFYLSFVALFVVLFYSYTKRFTPLCHLVLGAGLSLAPIGAFLAVADVFHWLPILVSILVLFWVSGFDIIYALQDEMFDKSNNLFSIPVVFGKKGGLMVSTLFHVIAGVIVIGIGLYGHVLYSYWLGAAVFCGMLIFQHSIVSAEDLSRVNVAFMTANGIASVIFALLVIVDLQFHYIFN